MKIALSRISTKTLATLVKRIIDESALDSHEVVKGHKLLTALITAYADYDLVYAKPTYSGKGKLVADANTLRDEAFVGMKFCIYGHTKIRNNSLLNDAKDLYQIFKQQGLDINLSNYSGKTAQLTKLIEILEIPENAIKIANLHLMEIFGILKTAQSGFENLVLEQTNANAKLRMIGTASLSRADLEKALHNYLSLVTAMKQLDGWDELYLALNEYVKSARNSQRTGKEAETTIKTTNTGK